MSIFNIIISKRKREKEKSFYVYFHNKFDTFLLVIFQKNSLKCAREKKHSCTLCKCPLIICKYFKYVIKL